MSSINKVIILTGPTAVGKTDLSIKLAKLLNSEIISADSMQVYKYLDIGTAKIKKDEMQGIKHHLIDILEPNENYNLSIFLKKADKIIKNLNKNGKIPIVVGGTALYINSLINGIDNLPKQSYKFREFLEKCALKYGNDRIYNMLKRFSPDLANKTHKNNLKRVIRYLEIIRYSRNKEIKKLYGDYDYKLFILNLDRQKLYDRANKRVDIMFELGHLNEALEVIKRFNLNENSQSMSAIGYKEILIDYLKNDITEDELKKLIKKNTRHFIKRQLTWFRSFKQAIWLDRELSDDKLLEIIINEINKKSQD